MFEWDLFVFILCPGNEEVIHLTGNSSFSSTGNLSSNEANVCSDNFWEVAGGSKAKKNNDKDQEYK